MEQLPYSTLVPGEVTQYNMYAVWKLLPNLEHYQLICFSISDDLSSYKTSCSFNIYLLYLKYSSKVSETEIGYVKQPISISLTLLVY